MSSAMLVVEGRLREVWACLLEVPADDIRPASDFLELGGNSMLLLGLQASIARAFGVELRPAALLDARTLAGMTVLVAERLIPPTA